MQILRISHVYYKKALEDISLYASSCDNYLRLQDYVATNNFVGLADFISEVNSRNITATEVFFDSKPAQKLFCNFFSIDFDNSEINTLRNQIAVLKPNIIFITSPHFFKNEFISSLKNEFPFVDKIIAHKGTPFEYENIKNYDLVYVCTPGMVEEASPYNVNVKLMYHYFSGKMFFDEIRSLPVQFSGSSGYNWGLNHASRYWYLFNLALETDIDLFLDEPAMFFDNKFLLLKKIYFKNAFKKCLYYSDKFESSIKMVKPPCSLRNIFGSRIKKPCFGSHYFSILRQSLVVFHKHTDDAKGYSGAMRLFEATGNGACLLTDRTSNINDIFPSDSVVTYSSFRELVGLIKQLTSDPKLALSIAKKGQIHCKNNHLVKNRVDMFLSDCAIN